MSDGLTIWTIYDHPRDYPTKWVLRPYRIVGGNVTIVGEAETADSLEAIRAKVPRWCVRLLRDPSDDPVIVERWV